MRILAIVLRHTYTVYIAQNFKRANLINAWTVDFDKYILLVVDFIKRERLAGKILMDCNIYVAINQLHPHQTFAPCSMYKL